MEEDCSSGILSGFSVKTQEKLPVAASFKCMAIKTSASLHSKKAAIHNCLLYSRISYYFSNGIQFRIFIIKMTIYSLFTINLTIIQIIFNSIFPQEIFKILNLPAVNDPFAILIYSFSIKQRFAITEYAAFPPLLCIFLFYSVKISNNSYISIFL